MKQMWFCTCGILHILPERTLDFGVSVEPLKMVGCCNNAAAIDERESIRACQKNIGKVLV